MSITIDELAAALGPDRLAVGDYGRPRARRLADLIARRDRVRTDEWYNWQTGRGIAGRDGRRNAGHCTEHIPPQVAYDLWQGNWLAARGIEIWPDEMTRAGWELQIDDESELATDVEQFVEDLGLDDRLWDGLAYERAYGGGAVLLGVNDAAGSLAVPLREESIQSFEFLLELEPCELQAATWYGGEARGPKVGRPRTYWLQPFTQAGAVAMREEIHESRLLIFDGIRVSRRQVHGEDGWGSSQLSRVYSEIRDYGLTWGSASRIMQTFNRTIVKMQNLYELLAQDGDAVRARMIALEVARDVFGVDLIDSEEEIGDQARNVTGLADLLQEFAIQVAAAFNVPLTKLMGRSPAGMNATGEFDQKSWYDNVDAARQKKLKRKILKVCRLAMIARGDTAPNQMSVKFGSLFQPSDKETAEARHIQAKTDEIYAGMGAPVVDILRSRFGGDDYSYETQIDLDGLEAELDEQAEAEARAMVAAAEAAASQPAAPGGDEEE